MTRRATYDHAALYEWLLHNLGDRPIQVNDIADLVVADDVPTYTTRRTAALGIAHLMDMKHSSCGERFARLHRTSHGRYSITQTPVMHDHYKGRGMVSVPTQMEPPLPPPPPPPPPASSKVVEQRATHRMYREIGVLTSGVILVKDSDDKIYELRPL